VAPSEGDSVTGDRHFQIGEAADRVGLSLRTIRYYEEIGLVVPSGRTEGGFRLYRHEDISRLELVKALKPLGLPLGHLSELLELCERTGLLAAEARRRTELLELASERATKLGRQLNAARRVLDQLIEASPHGK